MNSWMQGQTPSNNTNTMNGQMQYNPYGFQRLPTYSAPLLHGENAAWQFPMGPNSEIYLPDADEDIIWWIRTDGSGNKSVLPFDVSLRKKPKQANLDDILARLGAVEEWINAKSNKSNAKRANAAAATATENQSTTVG